MSSSETESTFGLEHRRTLLDLAAASIDHALTENRVLQVAAEDYPEPLRAPRASFVTLRIGGRLRGCMGSLQVTEPLVINVAKNAYVAAFRDPRFPPVTRAEFTSLDIHLSLLTQAEPVECQSEAHLLALVRPGIDGLILIEGSRRGTLLPSVWETLSDPRDFLAHLKRKAGLPPDYWSSTLRVERYTAESVGRDH
jgi:uncharacterized protein